MTKENSQEKTVVWGRRGRKPLYNPITTFVGDANSKPVASHRDSTLHALGGKERLFCLWVWLSFPFPFPCLVLAHPLGYEGRLCRKIGHPFGRTHKDSVRRPAQVWLCSREGSGSRFCVAAPCAAVRFVSVRHDRSALEILQWHGASCAPRWSVSLQSKITTCCHGSALGQTHSPAVEEGGGLVWGFLLACSCF